MRRVIRSLVAIATLALGSRPVEAQTAAFTRDARAIVTPTEARFVFPFDAARPTKRHSEPSTASEGRIWEVTWDRRDMKAGVDPVLIWLTLPAGYPWPTAHPQSVGALRPTAMIECVSCDGAVVPDPEISSSELTATIENGSLVFTIHGVRAVNLIFPSIPREVRFGFPGSGQKVKVNCGTGFPATKYHRECVVPPPIAPPDPDSTARENAPRRVNVLISNFTDAKLLSGVLVLVRPLSSPLARRMRSDSAGRIVLRQPPMGPIMIEALCKSDGRGTERVFGTEFFQIEPRIDTTVSVMTDPKLCPQYPKQR